jgi:hypothetical protein
MQYPYTHIWLLRKPYKNYAHDCMHYEEVYRNLALYVIL